MVTNSHFAPKPLNMLSYRGPYGKVYAEKHH